MNRRNFLKGLAGLAGAAVTGVVTAKVISFAEPPVDWIYNPSHKLTGFIAGESMSYPPHDFYGMTTRLVMRRA